METIKCQEKVDKGKSRIRGFHSFSDCQNKAKYKATYSDGHVVHLCGVHKQALIKKRYNVTIEELV